MSELDVVSQRPCSAMFYTYKHQLEPLTIPTLAAAVASRRILSLAGCMAASAAAARSAAVGPDAGGLRRIHIWKGLLGSHQGRHDTRTSKLLVHTQPKVCGSPNLYLHEGNGPPTVLLLKHSDIGLVNMDALISSPHESVTSSAGRC